MIYNFNAAKINEGWEILQMCFAGINREIISTVNDDSSVKAIDCGTLKNIRTKVIEKSYLTSIDVQQDQMYVGTGYGQLLSLDPKSMQMVSTHKIHSDCINSILEVQYNIVTAASDGKIAITDKRTMKTYKNIQVGAPISQLQYYEQKFYTAGVQSYQIDSSQNNVKSIGRYSKLLSAYDKLYGTNDQNGFTCISQKEKRYVPCQNMVAYKSGILGTSWQTISFFSRNREDSISCLSVKEDRLLSGYSINSLLAHDNKIYAGSQSGNLFIFELDMTNSWLIL